MVAMVQVTYSMPTMVCIPFTLGIVLINSRATPSGLLTQYLVYMVYTPGRHGITTTYTILMYKSFLHNQTSTPCASMSISHIDTVLH